MSVRTIRVCDICGKEFQKASQEAFSITEVIFKGPRHTDAAGQGATNSFVWEAHPQCWRAFAAKVDTHED